MTSIDKRMKDCYTDGRINIKGMKMLNYLHERLSAFEWDKQGLIINLAWKTDDMTEERATDMVEWAMSKLEA